MWSFCHGQSSYLSGFPEAYRPPVGSSTELTLEMQSCKLTSVPEQADDFDVDFDFGGNVDMDNFAQVLDMDDDEDSREFSRSIVFGFFSQAVDTFADMDMDM